MYRLPPFAGLASALLVCTLGCRAPRAARSTGTARAPVAAARHDAGATSPAPQATAADRAAVRDATTGETATGETAASSETETSDSARGAIGPVFDIVPTPAGGALIWARRTADGAHSAILGRQLDADGQPVGPARLLRRTAGEVVSLSAAARGDALHVGWIARLGDHGDGGAADASDTDGNARAEHVVAVLHARADLGAPSQPTTLQDYRPQQLGRNWSARVIELLVGGDGTAYALFTAAEARCTFQQHAQAEVLAGPCPTWQLSALDPAGHARTLRSEATMLVGDTPHGLVDSVHGPAWITTSEATGSFTHVVTLEQNSRLGDELTDAHDVRLAWTGDALIEMSRGTYASPDDSASDESGPRWTVRVVRADGTEVTPHAPASEMRSWPFVRARRTACASGRPVLTIRWQGGGTARLDLGAPGVSARAGAWLPGTAPALDDPFDPGGAWAPPMAWVGRALVAVRDGQLVRLRCAGTALVARP